jgi:hypothetical protein
MRERVRLFVYGCDWGGCTLKEICRAFGKLPHELSPRLSELKAEGLIFDSGRVRDGCGVWVSRPPEFSRRRENHAAADECSRDERAKMRRRGRSHV